MRTDLRPEDLIDVLEAPSIAVLATRRADDSIMLSPVWHRWRDGGFDMWAHGWSDGKVRHMLRDPRVTMVVSNTSWPYKGVEVRGTATVSDDPEAFRELVRATGTRYEGPEEGERMAREMTPGLVIRIEGVTRTWSYED